MVMGRAAAGGTGPPIVPPMARLRMRNMGRSNGQLLSWALVTVRNVTPSTPHSRDVRDQFSEYTWGLAGISVGTVHGPAMLSVSVCSAPDTTCGALFAPNHSRTSSSEHSGQPT